MLLVRELWRRTLKLVVLVLLAAEMRLLDARPTRSMLRRHGLLPRHAAAVRHSTSPGRWLTPCAGSTTADAPPSPVKDDSPSADSDDLTSQHGRRRMLRLLARQMRRLADRVDRLKQRYVSTHYFLLPFDAHCCRTGTAMKHPLPDRVKPTFVIFDIRAPAGSLTLSPERQSARVSKITNDALTWCTGCFIAVPI